MRPDGNHLGTPSNGPAQRRPRPDPLLWLVVVLVGLGGFLRLQAPEAQYRTPDERTYTRYAQVLLDSGVVAGTRGLSARYVDDRNAWTTPPPTRVGHTAVLASFMRIRGPSVEAGVALSRLSSILGLAIAATLAWSWAGPWAAVFTVILMAGAPVDMAMSRRAWQDGVVGLGSGLVLLCGLLLAGSNRRSQPWLLAAFSIAGAWLGLMKLAGSIVVVAVGVGVCGAHWARGRKGDAFRVLSATAVALVASWLLVAVSAGDSDLVFRIYKTIAANLHTVPYNAEHQDGSWTYGLETLWLLSPFTLACFFLGAVRSVQLLGRLPKSVDAQTDNSDAGSVQVIAALALFTLLVLSATSVVPYLKNLRFFSPGLAPMYVVAGWALASLLAALLRDTRTSARLWVAGALLALAVVASHVEYRNFHRIVATNGFPDLTLPFIRQGLGEQHE